MCVCTYVTAAVFHARTSAIAQHACACECDCDMCVYVRACTYAPTAGFHAHRADVARHVRGFEYVRMFVCVCVCVCTYMSATTSATTFHALAPAVAQHVCR